jgi:hypothetical protein
MQATSPSSLSTQRRGRCPRVAMSRAAQARAWARAQEQQDHMKKLSTSRSVAAEDMTVEHKRAQRLRQ